MFHNIKENAIFVADSHYNNQRKELKTFLLKLQNKDLETSQLFLVGDIFDFLSSNLSYSVKVNKEIIEIINSLSLKIEIFYFEGNHDFNLKALFPNLSVFPREQQPVYFAYKDFKVALAHGDIFGDKSYDTFCNIIRSNIFTKTINIFDFGNLFLKYLYNKLLKKDICCTLDYFQNMVKERIKYYNNTDIIIEGHYHQNKDFIINNKQYLNIPSLCCSKEYIRLNDNNFERHKI